jgi:arabinogalactan oligomer/maltooligosaccharide transport system permease protein
MAVISEARPPNSGNPNPTGFARWWERTTNTRAAYLYLVPAFIVMGIITFYPMFYQVWMSFTDFGIKNLRGTIPPNIVGLDNYQRILTGALQTKIANFSFWRVLAFNLVWTITNVPIHVVLGVLIAVLLNTPGLWFKKIYRAIYVLPLVLPWLVVATVFRNLFDQDSGAINMLLAWIGHFFGISKEIFRLRWFESIVPPIPWFLPGMPLPLSYYAMLFTNVWMGWPFMCIVATGALQSIPRDLYEAASIDGASDRQQFFNITVPLLKPAMIPAAMVGTIITFNLFNCIFFMSGGGPLYQTNILVTVAYDLVRTQRLYGIAAAFCVIIFFVLLALTLATNRITRATERYDV